MLLRLTSWWWGARAAAMATAEAAALVRKGVLLNLLPSRLEAHGANQKGFQWDGVARIKHTNIWGTEPFKKTLVLGVWSWPTLNYQRRAQRISVTRGAPVRASYILKNESVVFVFVI